MKVARVAEMRELDRRAVEELGIPTEILMENAGNAVYTVILRELGVEGKRFAVICGPGNNGGDGFVVARKLHSSGGLVTVYMLADRAKYQGAAKKNLDILSHFPVEVRDVKSIEVLHNELRDADVVVDALLGTGLDRPVEGLYRQTIEAVNASGKKVFAVDIPSGISGDTGQSMGVSIQADCTVTFGLPKLGNLLYPGYGRGGKLYVSHISFPPMLYGDAMMKVELAPPLPLPPRRPDTSKMDYGPVLVIAGAANYFWAPLASAYSILKAGGGYVFLACPKSLTPFIAQGGREVVYLPQKETEAGSISKESRDSLLESAARVKIVIIGPGLSRNDETQELIRELAREIDKPLLIDGDGIRAVAREPGVLKKRKAPTILTPHSGEMSELAGVDLSAVEKGRVDVLQRTAQELNAFIVLKGAHSLVGYPDGRVFFNVTGETGCMAGMATAGSGDVLNGTIAAMFCLGMDTGAAVRTGVFIHGLAGDLAAEEKGADGMTAQDILDLLPYAVRRYREDLPALSSSFYGTLYQI